MENRFLTPLLIAGLAFGGCGRVSKPEKDDALETVRRNVRLLQKEEIAEMMETIHPESPAFAGTRITMEELVKKFDLRCELTALDLVAARQDEMRVRFEQITEKVKGEGDLPKTKLVGIHVLKKDGGVWKIFDTEVIRTELLDDPIQERNTPAAE